MNSTEKRWQVAPTISPEANENLKAYSPILRQILYNRGYATHEEAKNFLDAAAPGHDPFNLTGMEKALKRIEQAIQKGEKIIIYGDYDADGVTGAALMMQTLNVLEANAEVFIPNRFEEGYGLNIPTLDKLKAEGANLILTVDCGIRAVPQADHASKIGLDIIVTDHHTPGEQVPKATALINPKQPGDPYPEKNLAGVGVAFKLASALIDHLKPDGLTEEDLIDLVAIGTVADLVPLVGENRSLVRRGLRSLTMPRRQGILSLLGVAGLRDATITTTEIGFGLGPRLNAAGRIASALDAYKLLITKDVREAGELAQVLDNRNRERQRITRDIQEMSESIATEDDPEPFILFAAHQEFNPGVVGLAASRLVEKYYRPAVVAHQGEEFTRASCRSIPEFHITDELERCADLLVQFGGHAAAAGFTVETSKVPDLVRRLKKDAEKELSGANLQPVIHADMEVSLIDLKPALLNDLDLLQPTGYGNPEAVFVSRNVMVRDARAVGRESAHLKLTVSDGRITYDAIAFRQGSWIDHLPQRIDLIFTFELNEFNGRKSLQLNVKDIKQGS
ncbi:MAG: single-stranded-DNA-specific exonuclease RecJ [Anaerolineales bacterium]|jgi:single-stranded-DNA-specific exonuclease